jgi:hypothetical protein
LALRQGCTNGNPATAGLNEIGPARPDRIDYAEFVQAATKSDERQPSAEGNYWNEKSDI